MHRSVAELCQTREGCARDEDDNQVLLGTRTVRLSSSRGWPDLPARGGVLHRGYGTVRLLGVFALYIGSSSTAAVLQLRFGVVLMVSDEPTTPTSGCSSASADRGAAKLMVVAYKG